MTRPPLHCALHPCSCARTQRLFFFFFFLLTRLGYRTPTHYVRSSIHAKRAVGSGPYEGRVLCPLLAAAVYNEHVAVCSQKQQVSLAFPLRLLSAARLGVRIAFIVVPPPCPASPPRPQGVQPRQCSDVSLSCPLPSGSTGHPCLFCAPQRFSSCCPSERCPLLHANRRLQPSWRL
jgi:hypothetical protein